MECSLPSVSCMLLFSLLGGCGTTEQESGSRIILKFRCSFVYCRNYTTFDTKCANLLHIETSCTVVRLQRMTFHIVVLIS